MRLLNSTTMEFKVFNDEELPLYAILSHTWGDEEISYQDQRFIQRLAALPDSLRQNEAYVAALEAAAGLEFTMMGRRSIYDRAGYTKIEMTAKIAKGLNMNWFWVDTCCIDKSSSAELQEAINSMYRWYEKSAYCIVFLEDAEPDIIGSPTEIKLEKMLEHSRWIIRGWTLQELIAPHDVIFYDSAWTFIGEKSRSLSCIRGVTGIPEYVLATGDLSRASVAQKMAWAARRTTSRIEDIAYSLLGIFQVYMPMLYGERENAFLRLQEEIIRTTPDDSIFAWTASEGSLSTYRGLFARSPREFRDSHLVSRGHGTFASSNMGLRIELVLRPFMDEQRDDNLYLGLLKSLWGGKSIIAIVLRELDTNKFARVSADHFEDVDLPEHNNNHALDDWDMPAEDTLMTIYVEHTLQIPPHFQSKVMHAFRFKRGSSEHAVPMYRICGMRPTELSIHGESTVIIPRSMNQRRHDFQVSSSPHIFIACVKLTHEDLFNDDKFPPCSPRKLIVGYNLQTGYAWCRVLGEAKWPGITAPVEQWRAALEHQRVLQDGDPEALISTGATGARKISVKVSPGLYEDKICLIVFIDGLSLWERVSNIVEE